MQDSDRYYHALREIGPAFTPEIMLKTRELFREAVTATEWGNRAPIAEVSYGPHERNRLDLYGSGERHAPVLLFVHGGGFVAGDKAGDPVFYGNVPRYFAEKGFLAASINYRLAPGATWPAGAEDLRAAIAWLIENAAGYGGDPSRIVLLGQSAGASHCASLLFDPRFGAPPAVRAAALLSGFYQAKDPLEGGPRLYFGDDPGLWTDRSPATHVAPGHVPLLISVAELDPAVIAEQSFLLAHALTLADGQPPRVEWLGRHNHVSAVHSLGLGEDVVGRMLCEFFAEATG